MSDSKECFFISPIDGDESDIRERSDKVMEYIIEEALEDFEYSVTRADQMDEPGSITNQVINKTVNSDLVIADLTHHNPNVFYELAVRHATGEPYIQLIDSSNSIPFDVNEERTIHYGLDVDEADNAREEIRSQVEKLRDEDPDFDNPVSRSATVESLRSSENPTDQSLAEILDVVSRLERRMSQLESAGHLRSRKDNRKKGERRVSISFGNRTITVEGDEISESAVKKFAEDTEVAEKDIRNRLQEKGVKILQ